MSFNLSTISPLLTNSTDHIINANFDFRSNPGLVFVLISCTCTGLWMLFLTFYLSRITGYILTKIIRRFYIKDGYLSIGSFSMSLLSGKFMFRNIRFITKDFSINIVDGQAILKWWLTYDVANISYYKKLSKDQDICDVTQSRLTFHLNGLEIHFFNRSDLYNSIQNILKCERYGDARKSITSLDVLKNNIEKRENSQESKINKWRELFPLIRMNIRSGKLAFGNRLLETTLWVHFNKGSAAYSMPDALSTLDYYTHFFQCKCDDLRVLLSKSPGYIGVATEPPRFMGQGFVVLQSGQAKILYYQDEPGLVPDEAVPDSDPEWGLNVVFTKSANITYGPWVDKQRDALQKFFFPNSFQELAVTKPLESTQQRLHTGFDVKVDFVDSTTLDLLFSKNEETSAIHICCSSPSSLHYYQPWVVNEYGYTSNLIAVLQKIDITTSLQFRKFLECDQIEVAINMMVPRMWNHFQHWSCELCLAKTTCHFVYDHENFFNDLFTDWSSSEPPDIAKFAPFDWVFNFNLRDFEIILMVNEHNWVECANQDENNELAICGESLDINFTLPNTSFLPNVTETNFFFRAETIMLRMFVPESNTLRRSIMSLARNSDKYIPKNSDKYIPKNSDKYIPKNSDKYIPKNSDKCMPKNSDIPKKLPKSKSFHSAADFLDVEENFDEIDNGVNLEDQLSQGWRRRTRNTAWIDVWSTPVFLLNIDYKYHPTPIENDTIKNINLKCGLKTGCDKNPEDLVHDVLTITLEAGPSAVRIFGYFWNQFFNGFMDNYFGVDQKLVEFNANKECDSFNISKKSNINQLDTEYFHPLEVNVTVVLLDIHAELTMHTLNNTESPQAFTDGITFEIHKTFSETKMQLIISPVSLIIPDSLQRHADNAHLSKGFLRLSGFQFRGHAMFSGNGIPLGNETIEYSWLTEIQCGNLMGKVTPFQLSSLTLWAETFALHFIDEENQFRSQNSAPDSQTTDTNGSFSQFDSTEDLRYKMLRFSIESVNVYLTEAECACNLLVSPIRFAVCNASTECCCQGGSLFINEMALRLYVQQVNCEYPSPDKIIKSSSNNWVEVGLVGLGPITTDISELCGNKNQSKEQYNYLTFYDGRSKRLWFLWESNELKSKLSVDRMKSKMCGCVGGCDFFGKNVNGVHFFTTQVLDATIKSSNRYGSGSLWGGQSTTGEKVKEYLRKLSGFIPHSNLSSNKSVDEKTKRSSEIFADQEETAESNVLTCPNKLINKGSKIDIKRSTSVLVSHHSLVKRFDSMEGSFYSCASENNLVEKIRSMKDLTLPSQSSDTSKASSSSSYASALSSVQDLSINLDEVDYPSFLVKPFCQPALLAAYASYLQSLTCINWRQKIPSDLQKNFSLLNNLKVICPPGHHYSSPSIPCFKPNIQGKLPFIIMQNSLSKEEASKDASCKTSENTKEAKKRYVTLKLHQQIICVLSPLVSKVVERYISAFESITSFCHPCHLLDHFHLGCISRSKEKFLEHCILNTFSQNKNAFFEAQINKMAPCKHMTFKVELPYFNVLFFQVSTESYTPSDTNSINGQCGSEYSFDIDTKNSDYTLLALSVSNIKVALHQQLENSSFNKTVVNFFQKFAVAKSANKYEIMYKLEKLIKPSSTALECSIGTAQLQLLHLKGHVDKVPHVTKISQVKSAVNFSVKLGGSLYTDPNNDVIEEDNLGNIICEAGVSEITIKVVLQAQITIAKELSNSETTPATVIDSELSLPVNRHFGDLNNRSSLCANSRTSLTSMSDWQKARKGYVALDIDSEENTTEPKVTFERSNIGSQQVSFKQQSFLHKDEKKIIAKDSCEVFGDANVKHFWINLATPTHLKTIQKATDQDINLVTVLIPAISSWVPYIVDLLRTLHVVRSSFKFLNYSTLACLMSQSLPENGKLLKKHFTVSAASEESSFLQGDYSSQLVCVLRRQTTGQRLITLLQALKNPNNCPGLADLEAGLQALSRQWKCVFIGAESSENIFAVKNDCIKKPVVGRGMLTQKDLCLLLNDKKTRTTSVTSCSKVDQTNPIQNIEDEPLLDSDSDTESESHEKAVGKEQSLYDWMSRSPTSIASLNKKSGSENVKQNGLLQETTKRAIELERLQSQMVSVPTSGVQLAEATEVFSVLLSVVGLINPKDVLLVWSHSKITCQLNKVSINLVESVQSKKVEDSIETFEVCNTNFCTSSDLQKSNESSQRNMTFAISINDLKQHVNFPLVRLILQISETFSVVLEQKKFAKKFIQQPNKVLTFTGLSAGQQDLPHTLKSWRNMYNVINLYIPKQISPDSGQNVKIDVVGPDGNSIIAHEEKVAAFSQKQAAVDRLTISGTFCLHNARLTASISGLEFSLDMQQLNSSIYYTKGSTSTREAFYALNQVYDGRLSESVHSEEIITLTVHMEETKICLSDSFFKKSPSNISKLSRVLMTCKVYKTNGIYNELKCKAIKSKLKTLLTIGPVAVEIPQHPGTLRFVSSRFTKKLHKYFSEFEDYRMSIREARQSSSDHNELNNMKESWVSFSTLSLFRITTSSILVSATLLPSLRAEYKIEQVSGFGNFNGKFKFALSLQGHSLSFKTKNQIVPLPASVHICLPAINVDGHYIHISKQVSSEPPLYSNGHGYLFVSINIGNLEQNLTTDLMNHLIFLQKGFIKEVNEVVQDVEENEAIPLWFSSYEEEVLPSNPVIYSIQLKISLIRITASIPSGTAVVLKTGIISVEFSNQSPSSSVLNSPQDNFLKLYGTVQFLFDLSLGQFTKNINTGQQDFSVFASFITSLYIANTFDNQSVENKRKETITVTLDQPRILIKLPAVDKGVLVYLHFKNGYDQWRIQRNIISSDFPIVVEHLFAKPSQENVSHTMDLVLQITITNMAVCLPLQDFDQGAAFLSGNTENEHGHGQALVVTVQEMSISCCSSGSFVSTGLFRKFRLQFNESFDHTALQWIINEQELMNTYCIPEGSYQLCSKTTSSATSGFPPKWLMTLFWKMCGVDIHIDCNIGKQLRLLTNALTTIMGESDVGDLSSVAEADLEANESNEYVIVEEDDVFDGSSLPLNQQVSLDKQLWMQTNLVNNLRRENADDDVINHEVKILQEIENALSVEFFKDVKMHFRRKSSRRPLLSHNNDVQKLTPRKSISSSHKSVHGKTHENFKKKSKKYVNELENPSEIKKVKFDHTANNPFPVQANTAKKDIGSKFSQIPVFDSINELGELDLNSTSKMSSNTSSISMDFELNIVLDIDSGKCTLHLSNPIKDGDTISENSPMVDISHKPTFYKADSFNSKFRQNHSAAAVLSSHLPTSDESVILLIPGVNARVHYLSSNYKEKEPLFTDGSDADSNSSSRKYANKIGSLNSVLSIQSLPKEMILRPSLLDFIEKALEPIMDELGGSLEENISTPATASVLSSSGSGLYSFPVNVVVIIRIDPSDIRFSCLPVSKVECLLRIPSLDFAITSCPPLCTIPYSNSPKKPNKLVKRHSSNSLLHEDNSVSASFSCTACLSRFSFCIFHPYGKQYPVLSESNFPRVDLKSDSNRPISGRKDSLSLNVEFIKFNLSRKRTKLQSDVNECEKQDFRTAVKVSVICDIGSAAFNCDMRRTHEILDVPKAWYKHDLMRRMFLGKEGTYATSMTREGKIVTSTYVAEDVLPASSSELTAINPIINFSGGHRRAKSGSAAFLGNLIGSPFPTPRNTTSRSQNETFIFDSLKPSNNETVGSKMTVSTNGSDTCSEWETNVVLTFNVSHVDVSTNTGNVMGQVVWSTNDLRLNAGILVSNIGVSTKTVELSIRQGSFNTHGGVIGGSIEVQEISTLGRFSENVNEAVSHKANLTIKSAEIRLDYMGSCIVMTSLSLFKVKLDNEWPFKLTESPKPDSGDVKIFVKCDVDWDELQIIMSRSTASDSTKLVLKLEEFFNQQHQSSVKLLSSLHKFDNSLSHLKMSVVEEPEKDAKKELKYQHWIKLLKKSCCKKLHGDEIPSKKVLIGGKLFIRGNFLSLACFHGSNFRSQSWALFTMKEPCLEFLSETKVVEKSCQVYRGLCVQKGIFSLGKKSNTQLFERRQSVESLSDFMATVRRVSRGRCNPPSLGAPVHEWLVFINTVNAQDLPSSIKGKEISEKLTHVKLGSGLRKVSFAPKYRYENDSEVIFGLPQFSLQLITEHDQPISCFNLNTPEVFGNSPHIVDTQLLSSFDDSICVTMDASLYFFLHDLILSYMKEKQSTVSGGSRLSRKQNIEVPEILPDSRSSTIRTECKYREFRSKGWKVEPRVRFLSWAGQQIEPVSIDWVLEKLGFMHAALTIPKWVQRGALDPLDRTLAHVMNKLLAQMVKDI